MGIFVTKPYLPPMEEFLERVVSIFDSGHLTNQGPQVSEFERRVSSFLGVENFHYVTNGTIALQIAMRALDVTEGEVITTPFSYVATTSSILWERCTPVFVDIEKEHFTIDSNKIESAITSYTKAIMPVHVFGYACDVVAIETIAKRHGLSVIYDAAHAFGSKYDGQALCNYGDIATLSFHATKLFHTIEGGACIVKHKEISQNIDFIKRFGHDGDIHHVLGINAKQDEFNAAMGNVNLNHFDEIRSERKRLSQLYDTLLPSRLYHPPVQDGLDYNYAYYPVVYKSEQDLLESFERLAKHDIYPRRYFYPSLNTLPYLSKRYQCPIAEYISRRIASLPLYFGLDDNSIEDICKII